MLEFFKPKKFPKPSRREERQLFNHIVCILYGTSSCWIGVFLAILLSQLDNKVFSVLSFTEKHPQHIKDYKREIKKLNLPWDQFVAIFHELAGDAVEYGKSLATALREIVSWRWQNIEISDEIAGEAASYSETSDLLVFLTPGGHALPQLDLLFNLLTKSKYRFRLAVIVEPEKSDSSSQRIFKGLVMFLQRVKLFHAIIMISNNQANAIRTVNVQDYMLDTGLAVLLHPNSIGQPKTSNIDFLSDICSGDEQSNPKWFGVWAVSNYLPEPKFRQRFSRQVCQDKQLGTTQLSITNIIQDVPKDENNMSGRPAKKESSMWIALAANIDKEELLRGLDAFSERSDISIKFYPSERRNEKGKAKFSAVCLREIEPPHFEAKYFKHFTKNFYSYTKKSGTTEKQLKEKFAVSFDSDDYTPDDFPDDGEAAFDVTKYDLKPTKIVEEKES